MTYEHKRAWLRCAVCSIALIVLCIIIAFGTGCMANCLVPPAGL